MSIAPNFTQPNESYFYARLRFDYTHWPKSSIFDKQTKLSIYSFIRQAEAQVSIL